MASKKQAKKKKSVRSVSNKSDLNNFNFFKPQNKTQLVFKNFLVFLGLFLFSIIGFNISTDEIFINFFKLANIAFMGVSVGLLITLLILIFLKANKK
jgi:hypothetical protein